MTRAWVYLVIGLLLLSSQALLDYVGVAWAKANGNTISAVSAVVGVVVTIYFINSFSEMRLAKQEEQRFREIKKIAFRSLSQTVNDLGRRILAPVSGVDLYKAGVPNVTTDDVAKYQSRLKSNGFDPLVVASGFWGSITSQTLELRIKVLIKDASFVNEMFRATSKSRRELQAALAEWAPVMVRVPRAYEDLSPGWPLADEIVQLAEAWRSIQVNQESSTEFESSEAVELYLKVVSSYRNWLERLQENADLPTRGSYVKERDWKA
jgi:hypothetical protein